MMKNTLYIKFVTAYLIFGFLSFFTIATLTSYLTLHHLEESKAEDLYKEATIIANNYVASYYNRESTLDTIQSHLETLGSYLTSSIWVVNPQGEIMINSESPANLDKLENIQGFDPTAVGTSYYQIGDFYGMFQTEMLSVMAPITTNFRTIGYVVIITNATDLVSSKDQVLNITYLTLLIIFSLSLIILMVFTFTVYRPLKKITSAANKLASGDLNYQVPIKTDDEIGHLAASLNYMSSELNKTGEYQKKFIANISHDFRSPLTSIKGYVEAILDGTIPPEMQERYLNIVLFETERLNKLTSSLLTLNNFDTKGAILDISDFDINSVIKHVSATFEGTCKAKKISIELILAAKTLYISADIGKIQQVLYNLIDNAIKFSNHESIIYVETTEKNEKVFISVKDTGIGIPKESIKKIWDRFYKTDISRGKDKKGTGLGLCITREIIQAHNENINVVSTEGVGTEFIFTLPKSKKHLSDEDDF